MASDTDASHVDDETGLEEFTWEQLDAGVKPRAIHAAMVEKGVEPSAAHEIVARSLKVWRKAESRSGWSSVGVGIIFCVIALLLGLARTGATGSFSILPAAYGLYRIGRGFMKITF